MAYTVELTPRAKRELEDLDRSMQLRIRMRIEALAENPRPSGVKVLAGLPNRYRIRVGDYRIIYLLRQDDLLVLVQRVGHRREVYRNF